MKHRQQQKRRKQHGATLVETLIVVPVFAIFLGGGYQIFRLTDARLQALYTARQAVWSDVIDGCSDDTNWQLELYLKYLQRLGGFDAAAVAYLVELIGAERTYTRVSSAQAPTSSPDPEKPRWVEPGEAEVEEAVLMGCNETPHDLGTRRSGIEWLKDLWFDGGE